MSEARENKHMTKQEYKELRKRDRKERKLDKKINKYEDKIDRIEDELGRRKKSVGKDYHEEKVHEKKHELKEDSSDVPPPGYSSFLDDVSSGHSLEFSSSSEHVHPDNLITVSETTDTETGDKKRRAHHIKNEINYYTTETGTD